MVVAAVGVPVTVNVLLPLSAIVPTHALTVRVNGVPNRSGRTGQRTLNRGRLHQRTGRHRTTRQNHSAGTAISDVRIRRTNRHTRTNIHHTG